MIRFFYFPQKLILWLMDLIKEWDTNLAQQAPLLHRLHIHWLPFATIFLLPFSWLPRDAKILGYLPIYAIFSVWYFLTYVGDKQPRYIGSVPFTASFLVITILDLSVFGLDWPQFHFAIASQTLFLWVASIFIHDRLSCSSISWSSAPKGEEQTSGLIGSLAGTFLVVQAACAFLLVCFNEFLTAILSTPLEVVTASMQCSVEFVIEFLHRLEVISLPTQTQSCSAAQWRLTLHAVPSVISVPVILLFLGYARHKRKSRLRAEIQCTDNWKSNNLKMLSSAAQTLMFVQPLWLAFLFSWGIALLLALFGSSKPYSQAFAVVGTALYMLYELRNRRALNEFLAAPRH